MKNADDNFTHLKRKLRHKYTRFYKNYSDIVVFFIKNHRFVVVVVVSVLSVINAFCLRFSKPNCIRSLLRLNARISVL